MKNKRIFVIGSGTSLLKTPINDLQGEDLFVMNKANEIWETLGFTVKPKYYFKQDFNFYDKHKWKEQVHWALETCEKLFIWKVLRDGYPEGHPNHSLIPDGIGEHSKITWFDKCHHSDYQAGGVKSVQSWHLPEICTAFGSMNPILQLCVQMGYKEIYLLGCDLYNAGKGKIHPIPGYDTDERDKTEQDQRNMLAIHEMVARCSPVPIYNATIGGSLEVYPRVKLKDIL